MKAPLPAVRDPPHVGLGHAHPAHQPPPGREGPVHAVVREKQGIEPPEVGDGGDAVLERSEIAADVLAPEDGRAQRRQPLEVGRAEPGRVAHEHEGKAGAADLAQIVMGELGHGAAGVEVDEHRDPGGQVEVERAGPALDDARGPAAREAHQERREAVGPPRQPGACRARQPGRAMSSPAGRLARVGPAALTREAPAPTPADPRGRAEHPGQAAMQPIRLDATARDPARRRRAGEPGPGSIGPARAARRRPAPARRWRRPRGRDRGPARTGRRRGPALPRGSERGCPGRTPRSGWRPPRLAPGRQALPTSWARRARRPPRPSRRAGPPRDSGRR